MKVFLASDHAGFDLKQQVIDYLEYNNIPFEDCGDFNPEPNDDYPLFIAKAAKEVSQNPNSKGIVFGKSGAGEEIVANKFPNVRAVIGFSKENVKLARQDNDANVLSLGSEFVGKEEVIDLVKLFLETPFSNLQRHIRRLDEIKKIE